MNLSYRQAERWMAHYVKGIVEGSNEDLVLITSHLPIYTMGPRSQKSHCREAQWAARHYGALSSRTQRGGEVTFHGPGQCMIYPLINLRAKKMNLQDYIVHIQFWLYRIFQSMGVSLDPPNRLGGLWSEKGKFASLGLKITQGVAWYGMAVNVNTNLDWFSAISPCAQQESVITSLGNLLGDYWENPLSLEDRVEQPFGKLWKMDQRERSLKWNTLLMKTLRDGLANEGFWTE